MSTKKADVSLWKEMANSLRAARPDVRADHVVDRRVNEIRYHQWRSDCVTVFRALEYNTRPDSHNQGQFFMSCGFEDSDMEPLAILLKQDPAK